MVQQERPKSSAAASKRWFHSHGHPHFQHHEEPASGVSQATKGQDGVSFCDHSAGSIQLRMNNSP